MSLEERFKNLVKEAINEVLDAREKKGETTLAKRLLAEDRFGPVLDHGPKKRIKPVQWNTTTEAAAFFGVSETTIRKWIRDDLMDAYFKWTPRAHWEYIKVPASKRKKLEKHYLKHVWGGVSFRVAHFFATGEKPADHPVRTFIF